MSNLVTKLSASSENWTLATFPISVPLYPHFLRWKEKVKIGFLGKEKKKVHFHPFIGQFTGSLRLASNIICPIS